MSAKNDLIILSLAIITGALIPIQAANNAALTIRDKIDQHYFDL